MIWAADRTQTRDQVAARLRGTARLVDENTPVVNPLAAVAGAVSAASTTNRPPIASFVTPVGNLGNPILPLSDTSLFRIVAIDVEDGIDCCTKVWRVDGQVQPMPLDNLAETLIGFPAEGTYTVDVEVTDSAGASTTASVTVAVRN